MGECSTQPRLTVIIPVYKAVETLGPCLESILSQGVQALQVVLIVDGSPDESGLLCDEWAKKDGRIQVIHQPNRVSGGPASYSIEITGIGLRAQRKIKTIDQ